MESIKNNNLDQLIFNIKRAMVYASIEEDYQLLKGETKKMSISLYSLHKIIEKLNKKSHLPLPCPEIDMFVVKNKAIKNEPDMDEKKTSSNNGHENDELQYLSLKDWMMYAAYGIIEMTRKMLKK